MAQPEPERPFICQCGCDEPIPWKPRHRTNPPRFIREHYHRWRRGSRQTPSVRRVPPGTLCACGCGETVPDRRTDGRPRYVRSRDGQLYLARHPYKRKTGAANPNWRGGRTISRLGYVHLYRPDHPGAGPNGYVPEHRVVWEKANGRRLEPGEHVYHLNGDRLDNRPENLAARRRGSRLTKPPPRRGGS